MANGTKPAVEQPQQGQVQTPQIVQDSPQQQPELGPMQKAFTTGMARTGFALLGSAFGEAVQDPAAAAPMVQMGDDIAQALHMRWWKQEYENFEASTLNTYKEDMQGIGDHLKQQTDAINLGQFTDAQGNILDPTTEQAARMRGTLEREAIMNMAQMTDQLMQASVKYANNPLIDHQAQAIMTSTNNTIAGILNPAQSLANEQAYADLAATRAQAEANKAAARTAGTKTTKNLKDMDIYELAEYMNNDMKRVAMYLSAQPDGRRRLNKYFESSKAQYAQMLTEQDPNLASRPDDLSTLINSNEKKLIQLATGQLIGDAFGPAGADLLNRSQGGDIFFPRAPVEQKPVIQKAITSEEQKRQNDRALQGTLEAISDEIHRNNPRELEDAIRYALEEWLPDYVTKNVDRNHATKGIRSKIINHVTKFIMEGDNYKNVINSVQIAQDKYGKQAVTPGRKTGTRGLLSRPASKSWTEGLL